MYLDRVTLKEVFQVTSDKHSHSNNLVGNMMLFELLLIMGFRVKPCNKTQHDAVETLNRLVGKKKSCAGVHFSGAVE